MKRFFCASLLLASFAAGCTKPADPAVTTNTNNGVQGTVPAVAVNPGTVTGQPGTNPAAGVDLRNVGPEVVVDQFLRALQQGNRQMVSALLTEMARTETTKFGLEVQPESVPNAAFRIVDAVYLTPEGAAKEAPPEVAHVASLWAEDGGEEAYEIIWVLKRQTEGWRIAAMGITIDFNQDPLLLDFEHPAEMMKARDQAMQEMANKEANPATQPGTVGEQVPGAVGPNGTELTQPQLTQPAQSGVANRSDSVPPGNSLNSPLRSNPDPSYTAEGPAGSPLRQQPPRQATQPVGPGNPIR